MSKADCIAAKAPAYIGMPYKLGEEGKYVAGPEQTNAVDIDCSGLFWALLLDCGVKLNGRKPDRLTADAYWHMATPIAAPSIPGDCCWFPKTGEKKHIALYLGDDTVIEAGYHGPNNTYPGAHYVGTCTVEQMNDRGAVWGRIKGLDIYDEEEEMDQATFDKMADNWAERNVLTVWPPDLKEASEGCAKLGLLETRHKGTAAVSVNLFRTALWRLAKKAGLT